MLDEVAQRLEESEQRIDRLIRKINELESVGRWSDAQRAREALAVITETRHALRLRLEVADKVLATRVRWASLKVFPVFGSRDRCGSYEKGCLPSIGWKPRGCADKLKWQQPKRFSASFSTSPAVMTNSLKLSRLSPDSEKA